MRISIHFAGIAIFAVSMIWSGVHCVDCLDKVAVQKSMRNCFSHWGVALDTKIIEIWNVIQTDPAPACKKRDRYIEAFACASEIWRDCTVQGHLKPLGVDVPPNLDERFDLLPDPDELGEALDFVCFYQNEYDSSCAKRVQMSILECADEATRTELMKPMLVNSIMSVVEKCDEEGKAEKMKQYSDPKYMICKTFEIGHNCSLEHMAECSARTQKVSATLTNRYLLPPACQPEKEIELVENEEDWKQIEHHKRIHEEL